MKKHNKRNKKGQYQKKHSSLKNHMFLFVGVIWSVNIIDFQKLPNEQWYFVGSTTSLVSESILRGKIISQRVSDTDGGGVTSLKGGEEVKNESSSSIEDKICQVFGDDCAIATAIAKAESGLKNTISPPNKNGTRDVGIFQINDCHGLSVEERLNPDTNIEFAKRLKDRSGWGQWSVFNNQSYKKYL